MCLHLLSQDLERSISLPATVILGNQHALTILMQARDASTSSSNSTAVVLKLSQMGSVAKLLEVQLLAAAAAAAAVAPTEELQVKAVRFPQVPEAVTLQ